MTMQMQILTTSKGLQYEDGRLGINPFYRADVKNVQENMDYAREVYRSVWRLFLCAWYCHRHESPIPLPEWEVLA